MAVTLNFDNTLNYIEEIKSYGRFKVNRVLNGEVRIAFVKEYQRVPTKVQGSKPTYRTETVLNIASTHVVLEKNIPIIVRMTVNLGVILPGTVYPQHLESISNVYQEGEGAWITAGRIVREIKRICEQKRLAVKQTGFYNIE